MQQKSFWRFLGISSVTGFLFLAGCQDKNKNGMPDSPATSGQIEKTVDDAGKTIEKSVEKAVPTLEKAVEKGAALASDAAITGKVKTAFMSNKSISAASIDVTTKNKIVYLDGTVATAAQRVLASKVAHEAAGSGHPIKNRLKVGKTH